MPAPFRPQTPDEDVGDCPSGFRFHSCVLNAFKGCCSIDPCARGSTCPDNNQPQGSSTTSSTPPSNTASSGTMASPNSIVPTPGPTIISSAGPALGNGQAGVATASLPPSQSSFITNLPTSPTTTFGVRPSSTAASSSLAPSSLVPSPSPSPVTSTNANNGNGNSDNSQSYPIGLIAGVVTGFSILMLVMGVLFVVLWRNKRNKGSRDSEASQMRGPRAAIPFYYVPPPTQDERQQQKGTESGASTPVRSARFPPEVDVMTPPPPMRMASSRRSRIFNKAWPAPPRDSQGSMQTPAPPSQPADEDTSNPSLAFPGRAMNYPDPLRADGLVQPPTGARAVHLTPVKANLVHNHTPSSSSQHFSPRGDGEDHPRRNSTAISPSSTIPGSITTTTAASIRSTITTADYEQSLRRHFQRFSGLVRSDSTAAHALSPPPRRPKTGDSEAEGSMSEGKLSQQPGLRLSGVDQGPRAKGRACLGTRRTTEPT